MESNVISVIKQFVDYDQVSPYGDGHINHTFVTPDQKYILQKINTNVFPDADKLMDNINNVTSHLTEKIIASGGDPNRETLTIVPTKDGKLYYTTEDGEVYRVYKFINDTVYYSVVENAEVLYQAGKAFGSFQNMLNDFPGEKLYETILNFHNTRVRFENLLEAIKEDRVGRLDSVKDEVNFALEQEYMIDEVLNGIESGEIPLRVTHNDTKINNVLFDKETGKALCVIDLDTVMPGSLLYDYGDALRTGAATAAEDEKDLSLMQFSMDAFKNFTKGFLEELLPVMTKKEIELLPLSIRLLTYECGIRFLTDHLNGDTYFKIHRENHNLDRARTQFKLYQDILDKTGEMEVYIKELTSK